MVGGKADQEEGRAAQHHPQSAPLLTVCLLFVIRLTVGGDGLETAACRGVEHSRVLLVLGLVLVEGADDADGAVNDAGERNHETKQLGESHHGGRQRDGQTAHGQVLKAAAFCGAGTN